MYCARLPERIAIASLLRVRFFEEKEQRCILLNVCRNVEGNSVNVVGMNVVGVNVVGVKAQCVRN